LSCVKGGDGRPAGRLRIELTDAIPIRELNPEILRVLDPDILDVCLAPIKGVRGYGDEEKDQPPTAKAHITTP
jgi:hypothetical protein